MIEFVYLGRLEYEDALGLQAELVALRLAQRIDNVLLLLEHPPVLTLGRNADRSNVVASVEQLAARGVAVHEINRGGDVTYHGPGQLVGYPIFDLRSLTVAKGGSRSDSRSDSRPRSHPGPVDFVRGIEEALIGLGAAYGVRAGRIRGLTGVWCPREGEVLDERSGKIAAIGIHVSRGVTSHGFAFNVTTDLSDFELIHPCGMTDRPVTSLALEIERRGSEPAGPPPLQEIAAEAARQFGLVFGMPVRALSHPDVLAAIARREPPKTEDTPLRIPPEVERLHGDPTRSVRA